MIEVVRSSVRLLKPLLAVLACAAVLGVSGCAGNEEKENPLLRDVTEAYEKAHKAMLAQNYRRAIPIYEALQTRFPFSELAKRIQLELMFAYYKSNRPEQAVDLADQFMRENPTHPEVDYALYIKALTYFDDNTGFLESWFHKGMENRPPQDATLSFSLLKDLVQRYPASEYAEDARQRMVFLKNRLAAYENSVARFYLERGAYVAALNRAKGALEEYNGAKGNPKSLKIMIEAYEGLGMDKLAADTRLVLKNNFPGG
ncbi:MAG TPA: outer membrane protein assembly factor BamD [Woeseiaceae bacterium]|jgi:outer membrane protein assembly factor BamD|nr:outer membrane protein assembly factor BamD [Woeseiaceae bacterium]